MGVRVARLLRAPTPPPPQALAASTTTTPLSFLVLSCLTLLIMRPSSTAGVPETAVSDALVQFKNSLANGAAPLASWDPQAAPPCAGNRANWAGVLCSSAGDVRGLRLESMGLEGAVDVAPLASLPHLRTLSFMNNTLIGAVPDLKRLGRLRSVYLSYNHFSGEIPGDSFAGMRFLKKVLLSNNELEGKIPPSLAELPRLVVLRADGNKFSGKIPDFGQQSLKRINVSNNELEGPIPQSLSKMDLSAFSGFVSNLIIYSTLLWLIRIFFLVINHCHIFQHRRRPDIHL